MEQKVTDILPPKGIEKKETKESLVREKHLFRQKEAEVRISVPPVKKELKIKGAPTPWRNRVFLFSFLILILVGASCYITLSKAEIEIWPKVEILTFETRLTIDKKAKEPDFIAKVIPGEILEKEKTVSETFSASGKFLKEKKAEGTIKIYNAFSTLSQVLVATTRFVSADGKLFRTPIKVVIPGGYQEKGKLIPGEIDVKVIADQPGPEYNIDPTTFSLPGFAGTERYTKFYAKSFQAMEGGFSQEVPQVTKDDLKQAETTLTKRAKEECEASFKNELQTEKLSSESYFLEKAIQTEIVKTFALNIVGDEVEEFNFQVQAKSKTLIFKKEDLKNFAKEFMSPKISEGKKLHDESLKIDFTPETINLDSGKIILSLKISAKIYSEIDLSNLKNNLKGKSAMETKVFLENQPEVTKVKVKLSPFWVKKVPESSEKINLKLSID